MIALIISVLVTLGTVAPGNVPPKKGNTSSSITAPTVGTHGGSSTWTNGGED